MERVDFDEDNIISKDDLKKMMDRLTGDDNVLSEGTKKVIIDKVSNWIITNNNSTFSKIHCLLGIIHYSMFIDAVAVKFQLMFC